MSELLELSAAVIDEGRDVHPRDINPISGQVSEVADGVAMVQAFSHIVTLDSGDGLVLFDTSLAPFGQMAVESIRGWRDEPIDTVVYTHGHVDHVGGMKAFLATLRTLLLPMINLRPGNSSAPSAR